MYWGYFKNLRTRRPRADKVQQIGLLNHMGGGNLGDDATQAAVIQNIKNRWPDAKIALFSMNPDDTRSRHGIPSYPIRTETWKPREAHVNPSVTVKTKVKNTLRKYQVPLKLLRAVKTATIKIPSVIVHELRFLGKSYRTIRSFDLFIISGGGQLLDSWGGPWKFPYTVFKWTFLAKLSCAKVYFLNVGAGPLTHPLGKWFVKSALDLADYVSFRDDDSRDLVQRVGFTGKSQVSADCVYTLDPCPLPTRAIAAQQENQIVGLSPMAYCDPRVYWQKDRNVYERFVQNIASFGGWLGQNHYHLALFSTDIWFDLRTTEDVKVLLGTANGDVRSDVIKHEDIEGIEQLLSKMDSMDYIVTCRFHGVVFAHLLNKPVIALSHHPKVSTLMNDLGLAGYCVDIRNCDVNILQETFLSLVANQTEIKSCMAHKAACYKRTLLTQFDHLFPKSTSI